MNRSEAQQARREREKARRYADAAVRRERAKRAETNGVVAGATRRAIHARNADQNVRGQTEDEPRPPRRPLYPAGSVIGNHPLPDPVGTINGFGVREGTEWRWGDLCWRCSEPTRFGYCTRCTWVCDNVARPEPEP